MAKQKRAVVTGGAGFIGSHLVDRLIASGWVVDIIDDLSGGKKERINANAHFHLLDIRDYPSIAPVISGADTVFHLAALPRVQFSIDFPIASNEVNVGGTLNVIHAAKEGGVGRLVYSASGSAYGDSEVLPLHERLPVKPVSPYALQKYVGEEYMRLYSDIYGIETVALRYFNVYGPRMDPDGAYALVIGKFLKMKQRNEALTITGNGEQTRDFTHVFDVVRANLLAAESACVGKGEVINIGSGKRISMNMLAKMLGGPIEYIPARKETLHTLADVQKAKELLDWVPEISLEEGIRQLRDSGAYKWGN